MSWNTAETQAKLKAAAVEEFAAHGLSGSRMERIAERAGVSKERLYNYFGSKEKLFGVVLSEELAKIAAAVPVMSGDGSDVGEYAGRCFDYHCAHPQLVRLLHWEALEYPAADEVPDEAARTEEYRQKVAAFAAAQRDGALVDDVAARDLLFLVMSMAAWWAAVPQVARMITGARGEHARERKRRRASVVQCARRMAAAG